MTKSQNDSAEQVSHKFMWQVPYFSCSKSPSYITVPDKCSPIPKSTWQLDQLSHFGTTQLNPEQNKIQQLDCNNKQCMLKSHHWPITWGRRKTHLPCLDKHRKYFKLQHLYHSIFSSFLWCQVTAKNLSHKGSMKQWSQTQQQTAIRSGACK